MEPTTTNEMMLLDIDRILEIPPLPQQPRRRDHQNIFSMECRHSERTRVAKYLQVNSSTGVFYKK